MTHKGGAGVGVAAVGSLKEQFRQRGLDVAQPERLMALGNFQLEAPIRMGGVEVFRRLSVGAFSYLHDGQLHSVSIGRFCSIGRRLVCLQPNHPTDWVSTHPFQYQALESVIAADALQAIGWDQHVLSLGEKARVPPAQTTIGHDVWIGSDVTIINGVTIGSGAVIGAGAVVTRDVEPYAIMAGNPARLIRHRFDETTRAALLATQWWNFAPASWGALPFKDVAAFVEGFAQLKLQGRLELLRPLRSGKADFVVPAKA